MTLQGKVEHSKNLIREYIEKYPKCCVAISFGKDSLATLYLVRQVKKDIPVFAVLSDTEFDETLLLRDEILRDWKLNYKEFNFQNDITKPEECCRALKVEQFKSALKDYDCWFSGIRADENPQRGDWPEVQEVGGLVKVNPILYFTEKDIWRYTACNRIPVNPLYIKYRSMSCRYCSHPEIEENEPERAGRWKGTKCAGGECGIHTQALK